MAFWFIYVTILFYMEIVFHLGCYGLQRCNPLFSAGLIAFVALIQALVSGSQRTKKRRRLLLWLFLVPEYLMFAVQAVYFKIFKQPLQIGAAVIGGQDALGSYWRETLQGILNALPLLLLLALPLIALVVLQRKKRRFPSLPLRGMQKLRLGLGCLAALLYCVCCMAIGNMLQTDYSEDYIAYYDPDTVLRSMGVLTMVQRDGWHEIQNLMAGITRKKEPTVLTADGTAATPTPPNSGLLLPEELAEHFAAPDTETSPEEQEPDTSPNVWAIDLEKLTELSQDSKETKWLADYIAGLTPSNRNQYTCMFKDYNLIYLTAEGFSTYAVREDLTPTLYKMLNSSFVFSNYYVPLWQTSTSDGEYVNCTGLIPDDQFSMRKSSAIHMAYTLPRFFAAQGVYSRAYHNHKLSYYDRYLTHPNLGYDFKAATLGDLSAEEWGGQIFPMEHPNAWPASDYEMMVGTLPEYINDERFHVYYMTVSGHMNYSFKDNSMSGWNQDAVADLDMSENARAYIACNIELDKALAYLLDQLEQAGKLDNTVICLSADHYPYGMSEEQYEELAGKDLSNDMNLYRNSLILWNAAMEEPVMVDKACCSVDILPTLLNLFGFHYDSRMYAGRDILSEEEGLVIFNDKSFVTDTVVYNRKQKTTTWLTDMTQAEQDEYMTMKKQDVNSRYLFSAYILRNNYYDIIGRCLE